MGITERQAIKQLFLAWQNRQEEIGMELGLNCNCIMPGLGIFKFSGKDLSSEKIIGMGKFVQFCFISCFFLFLHFKENPHHLAILFFKKN